MGLYNFVFDLDFFFINIFVYSIFVWFLGMVSYLLVISCVFRIIVMGVMFEVMSLKDLILNFFFVMLKEVDMEMINDFVQCFDYFVRLVDWVNVVVGDVNMVDEEKIR